MNSAHVPADWAEFRRQMPIARKWAYFDHAAVAPLPERTRAAVRHWVDQAAELGDTVWPEWSRGVERCRQLFARLIGANATEIALVRSTTEGIGLVAEGFRWQAGDNVVTLENEFPSNLYPWMNLAERGVETRLVPVTDGRVDLERLEQACDARTRIVSVSWVGYASGWRLNLDELAALVHRRGALLFVDAIQGLGAFPLDVSRTPIDFLAADGHKWLLGPEGAGVLFVRREHLDRLRPLGVGWHSVVQGSDYSRIALDLKPNAGRYEGGSQNMVGFLALAESLELLLSFGAEPIGRRILEITDLACQRLEAAGCPVLSPREGDHRSGIVLFDVPGRDPQRVRAELEQAGVVVRLRAGKLRLSPHAYADESDVDRMLAVLSGS